MTLSCKVIPRRFAFDSVNWIERNQDTCFAEVRLFKGSPALYCRGEHYGIIGLITDKANGIKALYKKTEIVRVERNQKDLPTKVTFNVLQ